MNPYFYLIAISAAIYVVIETAKKTKWLKDNQTFKDMLPIIPPVLGILIGVLVIPGIIEGVTLSASAVLGLLVGGLSSNSHNVIKKLIDRKGDEL